MAIQKARAFCFSASFFSASLQFKNPARNTIALIAVEFVQNTVGAAIFFDMGNAVKWALGVLGLLLVPVAPFLWFNHVNLLWVVCPLICVWAFWLMLEYLKWAKTLGKK